MKPGILITGVGAVIGQGIIKSLQAVRRNYHLFAIDSNPDSVGFCWADRHETVPRADRPEWLPALIRICKKNNIRLALPGIEQDIKAILLHKDELRKRSTTRFLINSTKCLSVSFDKWRLHQYALANNLHSPATFLLRDCAAGDFAWTRRRYLAKPREGMAGKGIVLIQGRDHFLYLKKHLDPNRFIIQEYIGSDNREYTSSIFGFGPEQSGLSPVFTLKRKLNYGSTFEAETTERPDISRWVSKMALDLEIVGPTNFQFRESGKKLYLLDINPRFSSSTSIKSAFGFNEPLMAIETCLRGKRSIRITVKKGRCFRYIEDHVVYR